MSIDLQEVVMKLVGPIKPVGKTETDNLRFENLKTLCELVDELVGAIGKVGYTFKDRQEFSVGRAGKYAYEFLGETLGIKE